MGHDFVVLSIHRRCFGGWNGLKYQFDEFLCSLNTFGLNYGIYFDEGDIQFGKTVHFLDVSVSIESGQVQTYIYSKPTDSHRYLPRHSFHPPHTFRSLPFSQIRRAALICSELSEREKTIDQMVLHFLDCGYKKEYLLVAKTRAMQICRIYLLNFNKEKTSTGALIFVATYSEEISEVKSITNSLKNDISRLTGKSEVIVACKRKPNCSAMLFNKFGFCQSRIQSNSINQKCGDGRCKTCTIMFENFDTIYLNDHDLDLKLSNRFNCKSEDVIYIAQCQITDYNDCYFGNTSNKLHVRFNVHRQGFKAGKYTRNVLSNHLYTDHSEMIGVGLHNYRVGIIDSVAPRDIERREDYYIWRTDAASLHLNRYQVMK